MSSPTPMPSLIPCQLRYSTPHDLAAFSAALSTATRKLSTQLPIKLTGGEGQPAWMIESPRLHGLLILIHSDFGAIADTSTDEAEREMAEAAAETEAPRCFDIKYREADRGTVEDLAALLGCTQKDALHDIDARDMVTDEPDSVTDRLLMASGRELEQGFHILDMAFASGQELVQNYSESVVADIAELTEIRRAIEAGDAEAKFGKQRVAQYLREEPKPVVVGENTVDHTLLHTLHIPSDSGMVLRVHYAWDPARRIHVIGYLDDYAMN